MTGQAGSGPPTKVPERSLKLGVAVLLSTFGTFWAMEGLDISRHGGHSLEWPGDTLALLVDWVVLSQVMIRVLRMPAPVVAAPVEAAAAEGSAR
jgi:Ca2+/H+ antiporter, TMEM165/GDT1 family